MCVLLFRAMDVDSYVLFLHHYWYIRKPWSSSIMLCNNNIIAYNHNTNNNRMSFYIYTNTNTGTPKSHTSLPTYTTDRAA